MIEIVDNKILMPRGDTLLAQVTITRGGAPYTPVPGDSVRFALKSGLNSKGTAYKEAEPLIRKAIPIDTLVLKLDPEDTKPLLFGKYKYDLEVTLADGTVDTFIENEDFTLKPEVD